jgi:hypothetical protein
MDFAFRFIRTAFDYYTTVLCVWWYKRRMELIWKREKEFLSSDVL